MIAKVHYGRVVVIVVRDRVVGESVICIPQCPDVKEIMQSIDPRWPN